MDFFFFINTILITVFGILAVKLVSEYKGNFSKKRGNDSSKPRYGFISPSATYSLLYKSDSGDDYIVIDVRSEKEFLRGHIRNAINIPIRNFKNSSLLKDLNKNEAYILCGQRHSSAQKAMEVMKLFSFMKIYCMTGGMIEWGLHDYPTER